MKPYRSPPDNAKGLGADVIPLATLGVALVLAAALRCWLAPQSLSFDEYASVFFATQPLPRLWSLWMLRETNPPLFYTILHGWLSLVGWATPLELRAPSIAASLATIAVVFSGIRRFYSARAAAVAALMLALSAQQIFYAADTRCYSLLFLALSVSFFGLGMIITCAERAEAEPVSAWIAYGGGALIAIYLHTTACLWPVIASLSLMLADRRFLPVIGDRWVRLVIVNGIVALGAMWWVSLTYLQMRAHNPNIYWLRYLGGQWAAWLIEQSIFLTRNAAHWQRLISLSVTAFAVLGAVRTRRMAITRLTVICLLVAITTYLIVSHQQSILVERTLVWIALFPLILAAAGLDAIRAPWRFMGASAGLLLLLATNLALSKDVGAEDWRAAITTIARDPNAALVVSGEGAAVGAVEACRVYLRRSACPFPIVTVSGAGERLNAWAHGYAPAVPTTPQHRLALGAGSHIYLINFSELPLALSSRSDKDQASAFQNAFFLGPYPSSMAAALNRQSRIIHGLVDVPGLPPSDK